MSATTALHELDATAQAELVRRGEVSPRELVEHAIQRVQMIDPVIGAVVIERFDAARREAAELRPGAPFAGVPTLLKDAGQELAGEPHYAGVAALREVDARSPHTTELARRFGAAGFVTIGRSKCPPLSSGVNTEPPGFTPTRNPWALDHTPGGSSGGAAAAVAAGLVPLAHGSDATGSLRYPASWCGVLTIKPTRGAVPVTVPGGGPDPCAIWSEYVLTRSVRDLVAMWPILTDVALASPRRPPRISLLRHDPVAGLPVDEATIAAIDRIGDALAASGLEVRVAHPDGLVGLRDSAFPRHNATAVDFIRARSIEWVEARLGRPITVDDFDTKLLEAAERGRSLSAAECEAAFRGMEDVIEPVAQWFERHDVLVTPVTHQGPPRIGESESFGLGIYCAPFSFTGQPAMSIPVGRRADGTPMGVQLVGARGADGTLLDLAAKLEAAGLARAEVAPAPVGGRNR